MNEKVISNTFTVNTVVDGISQQQIFTRNANAALPPRSQSDTPTLPSGWTYTPQGVDNTHPDEYVSMRSKDSSGVWSDYSPKVPYSHYGEDGTSLRIVGYANWLFGRNASGDPKPAASDIVLGDVDLLEYSSFASADHIEVCEEISTGVYSWEAYAVQLGTCYIFSGNNHIYEATESGWLDLGNIKGPKGDDGVMYVLEPSIPQFNTDQGRTKVQTCTVRAYKIEGKTKSAFTGCFEILSVVPDGMIGSLSYSSGNYVSFGTNDDRNATAYTVSLWDKDPRFIAIDEPEPVLLASINIPIAFDGEQGERGKIGRFFYFGGVFNAADNDPTHAFVVNDAQAPYFEHTENGQKRYHVFNYDTNGTYTMAQMWAIRNNWNSRPWEAMTNDFKYIITQAVFAALAKLGSWTFNSDYMYSDLGLNHSSQQESAQGNLRYDGIDDSDNTWTPNVSIDAANGRASFGRDKVRFNPDGAGWLANKNIQWDANGNANFNGIVRASLMYANVSTMENEQTGAGTYEIDLVNYPAYMFLVPTLVYGTAYIKLPYASNYEGVELRFYLPLPVTRVFWNAVLQTRSSEKIVYPSLTNITATEERATEYTLPQGRVVTLKSMKTRDDMGNVVTYWFVIGGYQQRGLNGEYQIGGKSVTIEEGRIISIT